MSSIRRQLLAILLLAALAPVLLSVLANVTLTRRTMLETKREEIRNFGKEIARQISVMMESAATEMGQITDNPALTDPEKNQEARNSEFQRMCTYTQVLTSLALLDPNGFMKCSTDDQNMHQREMSVWFDKVLATQALVMGDPVVDASTTLEKNHGIPVLYFDVYRPVFHSKGEDKTAGTASEKKLEYVVKATVKFDTVWDIMDGAHLGKTGQFVLLDHIKNELYHKDKEEYLFTKRFSEECGVDLNEADHGEFTDGNGRQFLFEVERLDGTDAKSGKRWTLISMMEKDEALALSNQNQWNAAAVAGVTIVLAFFIGRFLAERLARPVISVSGAAREVADGKLGMKLPARGPMEMRELANAFNDMTLQLLNHKQKLERYQEHLELEVANRTSRLRESQLRLEELHAQLRSAYESTREAILVIRKDGDIIAANNRISEIFGITQDELPGKSGDWFHKRIAGCFAEPEKFESVWRRVGDEPEAIAEEEWRLTQPKNRDLALYTAPVRDDSSGIIARLWMFRDISEQRLLELSLRQAQKMDAIGRLAGGVAHDFNNLLLGILGNLSLVESDATIKHNAEMQKRLHAARHAGQRAAELVKGLLGFSRQSHLKLAPCNVNDLMREVENIIRHTFDPRIILSLELNEHPWGLVADANQIEQVIMNMVVNAKDAMPNGGTLRLSTSNAVVSFEDAELMPGAYPGEFVLLSVADSGFGMTPEVRSKIFEPFFTTKDQGKGTGLGLATSFGTVEQHGGWIAVDSTVGVGTTFHIYLPRKEVTETAGPVREPKAAPRGGRETVMLVDDEAVVIAVGDAILKKHGYQTILAYDGEEAIDKLARHDGGVDLVIMDMTMPRLSGKDTFHAMKKGPARNVPVIICSGYLVDLEEFADEHGNIPDGFLQKPYGIEDIVTVVREVLDTSAAKRRARHSPH